MTSKEQPNWSSSNRRHPTKTIRSLYPACLIRCKPSSGRAYHGCRLPQQMWTTLDSLPSQYALRSSKEEPANELSKNDPAASQMQSGCSSYTMLKLAPHTRQLCLEPHAEVRRSASGPSSSDSPDQIARHNIDARDFFFDPDPTESLGAAAPNDSVGSGSKGAPSTCPAAGARRCEEELEEPAAPSRVGPPMGDCSCCPAVGGTPPRRGSGSLDEEEYPPIFQVNVLRSTGAQVW